MEFQDNLIQYVFSLMCQYEARFYNLFVERQATLKIPVSLMKMSYVCPLIGNLTSQYLNECYKVIILKNNDKLSELYNKAIIKVTNIPVINTDSGMSKVRGALYNHMKTDLKAVLEYEFEF